MPFFHWFFTTCGVKLSSKRLIRESIIRDTDKLLSSHMTCYFHSHTGSVTCIWWRTTACVSRSGNRRQPSYGASSPSCDTTGCKCFPVQSFRDSFLATAPPWISATWGRVNRKRHSFGGKEGGSRGVKTGRHEESLVKRSAKWNCLSGGNRRKYTNRNIVQYFTWEKSQRGENHQERSGNWE